jgi:hypothetical protein
MKIFDIKRVSVINMSFLVFSAFSLLGCSFAMPEYTGTKADNGRLVNSFSLPTLNDTTPADKKLVIEDGNIANLQKTNAPKLRTNQQWSYYDNDLNAVKVTKVMESAADYYIIAEEGVKIKYYKNLKIIENISSPGGEDNSYLDRYHFPMYVGKQWEYDLSLDQNAFKVSGKSEGSKAHVTCEIISYDDVTVKAGIFRAYKIYEQVNSKNKMASSYYWYSPEVGAIIKSVPRSEIRLISDIELISYQ